MGETLGEAGVSVEGGGVWVVDGRGVGHFLFDDGDAARTALDGAGLEVVATTEVLTLRLRQDEPGQLGKACRMIADEGANIRVQYSDHAGNLVLVVDDPEAGRRAVECWEARP